MQREAQVATGDHRRNGSGSFEYEFSSVDRDSVAMAAIFFEDGMTYLRLGDLRTACEMLQRAHDADPTQGIYLAYHAYSVYRQHQGEPGIKEETMRSLNQALRISPADADVYLIIARFHLKCMEIHEAEEAFDRSRMINPSNPNLASVEKSLRKARDR